MVPRQRESLLFSPAAGVPDLHPSQLPLSPSCLRCNTLQTSDPTYFKSCTYDPFLNPFCPVFRVRDMVEAAGETFGDLALLVLVFFKSMEDDSKFLKDVGKGWGQD